jgi:serine acetyltransferase
MKEHNYGRDLPLNKYNPLAWVGEDVKIGENCWIGAGCVVVGNIEIGDNVSLACGTKIFDHDTSYYRISDGKIESKYYKITIGNCCHFGANSVVVPNGSDIVIADHCIIGALTFVNQSFKNSGSVIVGIPGKFVKYAEIKRKK